MPFLFFAVLFSLSELSFAFGAAADVIFSPSLMN